MPKGIYERSPTGGKITIRQIRNIIFAYDNSNLSSYEIGPRFNLAASSIRKILHGEIAVGLKSRFLVNGKLTKFRGRVIKNVTNG